MAHEERAGALENEVMLSGALSCQDCGVDMRIKHHCTDANSEIVREIDENAVCEKCLSQSAVYETVMKVHYRPKEKYRVRHMHDPKESVPHWDHISVYLCANCTYEVIAKDKHLIGRDYYDALDSL